MTSQPRKSARDHEAHIYMTEKDYRALKREAVKSCRSVNGQILFYIQQGLSATTDASPKGDGNG